MFKRVVNYKGFWKSVIVLAIGYCVVLSLVEWLFVNFTTEYFQIFTIKKIGILLLGGFIAGFFVAYGKFWGKIKEEDYRK